MLRLNGCEIKVPRIRPSMTAFNRAGGRLGLMRECVPWLVYVWRETPLGESSSLLSCLKILRINPWKIVPFRNSSA
jgi:hypothetical protein